MKVLFIHQGFPGQFKHLIPALIARGDEVSALVPIKQNRVTVEGVNYFLYKLERGNTKNIHPLILETESKVIRGEATAKAAEKLRDYGYHPDIIICHPGWGETLFINEVWRDVQQLHYVEYSYQSQGGDADFDDIYACSQDLDSRSKNQMKNANVFLNLTLMTHGITPTKFQHMTLPAWSRDKVSVIHDGIDTKWLKPSSEAKLQINESLVLTKKDELISFVNRTYEPYRGIHTFIECLEEILCSRPKLQVVMVGKDVPNVSYGKHREDGQGWFTALKKEYRERIDWDRVHNLGQISHNKLKALYQITSAHIYLTYPFVLSWSMLEAMSCGALVIEPDSTCRGGNC